MKKLTIIGGGSSTHTLIPMLSESNYEVNLITSKPDQWSGTVETHYVDSLGETKWKIKGDLNVITSNPELVIPESEVIILCMPVHKYREALANIAEHINKSKNVYIGTIYGQAGFNWMVQEIKNKYGLDNVVTFAVGLIPWICRIKEYGHIGITYGPKEYNVVAVQPSIHFDYLNGNLFNDICYKWFKTGKFHLSDNFISLTLSVDNQIIHTSRLFDLSLATGGMWDHESEIPFFYKDYTKTSATMLEKLDEDYSAIRNKIKTNYSDINTTYMLDYLALERLSYQSKNSDVLESFVNSKTLGQIKTPVIREQDKFIIDKHHRFFYDDIYYGLMIAKWFAEKLEVEVKTIDRILYWAQDVLKDDIIKDNKLINREYSKFKTGLPSEYGFKSVLECLD